MTFQTSKQPNPLKVGTELPNTQVTSNEVQFLLPIPNSPTSLAKPLNMACQGSRYNCS